MKSIKLCIAATIAALSITITGCGDKKADDGVTVVKIGVVGDYNLHWDDVNKNLAKDKIQVKLVKFSDYATPNRALSDKRLILMPSIT